MPSGGGAIHIEKNSDKLVKSLRVHIQDQPGYVGKLCTAIGQAGGNIGEIRTVSLGLVRNTREVDALVATAVRIAPTVWAINLEAISAQAPADALVTEMLDRAVHQMVAEAVAGAARAAGVARAQRECSGLERTPPHP